MTFEEQMKDYEHRPIFNIKKFLEKCSGKTYEDKIELLRAIQKYNGILFWEEMQRSKTLRESMEQGDDFEDCLPAKKQEDYTDMIMENQDSVSIVDYNELLKQFMVTSNVQTFFLNMRHTPNFVMMMKQIKLAVREQLNDFYHTINTLDVNDEYRELYIEEHINLKKKLEALEESLMEYEYPLQYDNNKFPTTKILFLLSERMTPYFHTDLEDLEIDMRILALKALRSIQRKNFNGCKGITVAPGMCELRREDVRVFFRPLNNDTYLIMGAYLKKMRRNSQIDEFINRRQAIYDTQKEDIKNSTVVSDVLDYHQSLLGSAFEMIITESEIKHECQ